MPDNDKTKDNMDDADRFWDIDLMLPLKRVPAHAVRDTETVEITSEFSGDDLECGIKGENIPQDTMIDRIPQSVLYEERKNARMDAARKVLENLEKKHLSMRAASEGDRAKPYNKYISDEHSDASSEYVPDTETYRPEGNSLLCEVSVSKWPSRYTFYHKFRTDAARYHGAVGKECRKVPYFSFTPQYDQLDSAQLNWYLWWRENVRGGIYPATDYSYILLYIYEIINLPDILPPNEGVMRLCEIWKAYRGGHPKLDKYLSEWVCDYCLIHRIKFPAKELEQILPDIIKRSSFKEFYIGYGDDSGHPFATAFYNFGAIHNWRNSKYITDENREFFEKHIKGAFIYAFSKIEDGSEKPQSRILSSGKSMSLLKLSRDAYNGALCAYDVKRRIDVSYYSCTKSVELRYAASDLIKYAENNVRSMLSIKSRYHITQLDMYLKRAADEYFAPYKVKKSRRKAEPPLPDYEKNYESEPEELSADAAGEIEERAWSTAKLLIDSFEDIGDEISEDVAYSEPVNNENTEKDSNTAVNAPDMPADCIHSMGYCSNRISDEDVSYRAGAEKDDAGSDSDEIVRMGLKALFCRNMQAIYDISKDNNMLPVTLIEMLNEACCDIVGDIAVEEDAENGWKIISDYEEELEEWLNNR